MLKQVVHRVTSGPIKVVSSEEPSATTLMFRTSITILISTDGIHKELLWFSSLKLKNVCVTHPRPALAHYNDSLNHSSFITNRHTRKMI